MARQSDTRRRVAEYLAKGLSPRQIADILHISTQRVYQHKKALEAE
jgi:DNA-binding CsgD family transcriptional regulator